MFFSLSLLLSFTSSRKVLLVELELVSLALLSGLKSVEGQDLAELERASVALKFLRQDLSAEVELVSLALVSDLKPGHSDESSH